MSLFRRGPTFNCTWIGVVLACLATGCSRNGPQPRVVLYCAQDQEFAEEILTEFTRRTGIKVDTKYDTEADKSVSLYYELITEKEHPRCDVFWNNEVLSTIRLQRQGLLAPLGNGESTWSAFAMRARVLVVNTDLVPESDRPRGLRDLTKPQWKGKVAMARPQFGTSATQAACLFQVLGVEQAQRYYQELKRNGIQIAPGNKQVAEWVGQGRTPLGQPIVVGITDTDDAMGEIEAGRPVKLIFPDCDASKEDSKMGTLFIPNSLAVLKGCPHPEAAQQLVEFLRSKEIETRLAQSASHQMPLFHPDLPVELPPAMQSWRTCKRMNVDFEKAADLWEQVQKFVQKEFARP